MTMPSAGASAQEAYDTILSYSPYDNVDPVARRPPAMLLTASLNDPRVPYWGPAKYVARLRAALLRAAGADADAVLQAADAAGAGTAAAATAIISGTGTDTGATTSGSAEAGEGAAAVGGDAGAAADGAAAGGGGGAAGGGGMGPTGGGGAGLSPGSGGGGAPVRPLLLLTEMGAGGHFSASGASGWLGERAMRLAFLLGELGRTG
ncbi:Protease 2 [Tetrabaena socialis]|uniref:Prolyl endopeptidase n=1 Tax=Tetrabaena socialis TaxID=47790 RepID=A0A2J7ZW87_9CHLO|nr:Protease 2 [Tetrabaena socialis]|eukprot:PNH04518.1 Protease 2 [Tetrabaena socialis]